MAEYGGIGGALVVMLIVAIVAIAAQRHEARRRRRLYDAERRELRERTWRWADDDLHPWNRKEDDHA